jgi:hypothetical protein
MGGYVLTCHWVYVVRIRHNLCRAGEIKDHQILHDKMRKQEGDLGTLGGRESNFECFSQQIVRHLQR